MEPRLLLPAFLLALLIASSTASAQPPATDPDPQECTVVLESGRKIPVTRFWRVSNERVEYERDGSLHDLETSDIRSIHCDGRDFAIVSDTVRAVSSGTLADGTSTTATYTLPDGSLDYKAMGKADARKNYNGGGAFVGSFLTTPLLLPPLIIAAVPPAAPRANKPNASLYWKEPAYRKGYTSAAHSIKVGHVVVGLSLGLLAFLALTAQ